MDNPQVNALGFALRDGIMRALEAVPRDAKAVVLHGTARAFSGGADITEFGRAMQDPNLRQVITAQLASADRDAFLDLHAHATSTGFTLCEPRSAVEVTVALDD